MVIAHHLLWTAYGYWLPNDPRGSMSKTIASDVIADLGEIHYGRKKVQPAKSILREFHVQSSEALKFSLLDFRPEEFSIIAAGLEEAISVQNYTCYACAIMPDHVHILIRKHKHQAEEMLVYFQESSRLRLRNEHVRTFQHPVWGGPGWKVFLDSPADISRTIRYIEENPGKWRLSRQLWPFVKKYDGWPLHPRHNPNSPYARAMRTRSE
jgi:REP element-mobilizing transposase RayT